MFSSLVLAAISAAFIHVQSFANAETITVEHWYDVSSAFPLRTIVPTNDSSASIIARQADSTTVIVGPEGTTIPPSIPSTPTTTVVTFPTGEPSHPPSTVVTFPTGEPSHPPSGPLTLLWPASRPWAKYVEHKSPCGSTEGVGKRTSFPMTGGKMAVAAMVEAGNIHLSVSTNQDPKTESDFKPVDNYYVPPMQPGHRCYEIPDLIKIAGENATLRLSYTAPEADDELTVSDSDSEGQEDTFYQCADVTFVDSKSFSSFDEDLFCFNVTAVKGNNSLNVGPDSGANPAVLAPTVAGVLITVALVSFALL